jgi:hypothetical protein
MDGRQLLKKADKSFGAVEGVYVPQNTPMLWQCIIAGTKEHFEGHTHPQPPQKLHPLAWGAINYPFKASARSARPHVGRRGAVSAGGGHGCGVVTPVVFCNKATEKCNKNTKISCL